MDQYNDYETCHPDKTKDPSAGKKFREILETPFGNILPYTSFSTRVREAYETLQIP